MNINGLKTQLLDQISEQINYIKLAVENEGVIYTPEFLDINKVLESEDSSTYEYEKGRYTAFVEILKNLENLN